MTSAHTGAALQKRVPKMAHNGSTKTLTTESSTLSIDQLARLSEVSEADIRELMDYGVLLPASSGMEPLGFRTDSVAILRHAGGLRRDLALDNHAFSLAVMFLDRISALETELARVRVQLHECFAKATALSVTALSATSQSGTP